MKPFRIFITSLFICLACLLVAPSAWAFCGFYVAKADTKLYNQASQVAIAHAGNRTVLTMANDFQGEVKDFAIVVPVPVVLRKDQIKVAEPKIIERLDAFSAPRLVEYFDEDPCDQRMYDRAVPSPSAAPQMAQEANRARKDSLGVTVEARYTVGEYDILLLSAKESDGLQTWLTQNGYKIPKGANQLLKPYIRQKLKFFVAKVNLAEYDKAGYQSLRPLQIAYESPRFMLPIRLGMINAKDAQDLLVYVLSPRRTNGGHELSHRQSAVRFGNSTCLSKMSLAISTKSMFQTAYDREDRKVAFMEYAWDMANCDPCSAEPLSSSRAKAGRRVLARQSGERCRSYAIQSLPPSRRHPSSSVFITRLHVRYTRDKFPEDLVFQETGNRDTFQGRYVLRHTFNGEPTCKAAYDYRRSLPRRFEQQAQNLSRLTGWNIQDIRKKLPQIQRRCTSFLATDSL